MNVPEVLAAMARHFNLPELTLNPDGVSAVLLPPGVDLHIGVLSGCDEMRWTMPLGQPDLACRALVMTEALLANAVLASFTHRHFAWEADRGQLVLCETHRLDLLSPDSIPTALETFIRANREGRQQLQAQGYFSF